MFEYFSPTGFLVHAAALSHVVGYVARDQLRLRLLLLLGNALYFLYYWRHPDTPLWDAMFWSMVMIVSNTGVIAMMIRDRRGPGLSLEEAAIFGKLGGLSERSFRKLHKQSATMHADGPTPLIAAGQIPDKLYFLLLGDVEITWGDQRRQRSGPCFLGEVSILLNQPAIASVTALEGAEWLEISRPDLARLTARDMTLDQELNRLLSRDIASKLTAA